MNSIGSAGLQLGLQEVGIRRQEFQLLEPVNIAGDGELWTLLLVPRLLGECGA